MRFEMMSRLPEALAPAVLVASSGTSGGLQRSVVIRGDPLGERLFEQVGGGRLR